MYAEDKGDLFLVGILGVAVGVFLCVAIALVVGDISVDSSTLDGVCGQIFGEGTEYETLRGDKIICDDSFTSKQTVILDSSAEYVMMVAKNGN